MEDFSINKYYKLELEDLNILKIYLLKWVVLVSSGTKFSPGEIFETKRLASLQIHVERIICWPRDCLFLTPHACNDNKLLQYTDKVIKIVYDLINLQLRVISGQYFYKMRKRAFTKTVYFDVLLKKKESIR